MIAPWRMQRVQTKIDVLVPWPMVTRTFCRFGLNCRRAMPVTLVPTPPKYFALPGWSRDFPSMPFCRTLHIAEPS